MAFCARANVASVTARASSAAAFGGSQRKGCLCLAKRHAVGGEVARRLSRHRHGRACIISMSKASAENACHPSCASSHACHSRRAAITACAHLRKPHPPPARRGEKSYSSISAAAKHQAAASKNAPSSSSFWRVKRPLRRDTARGVSEA